MLYVYWLDNNFWCFRPRTGSTIIMLRATIRARCAVAVRPFMPQLQDRSKFVVSSRAKTIRGQWHFLFDAHYFNDFIILFSHLCIRDWSLSQNDNILSVTAGAVSCIFSLKKWFLSIKELETANKYRNEVKDNSNFNLYWHQLQLERSSLRGCPCWRESVAVWFFTRNLNLGAQNIFQAVPPPTKRLKYYPYMVSMHHWVNFPSFIFRFKSVVVLELPIFLHFWAKVQRIY